MTRETLEERQIWFYLAAIALGMATGAAWPAGAPVFEAALWPALALLLTASFTQVPLDGLPRALRDSRFIAAILVGNFVAVPLLVALLLPLAPADPAVRLGLLLVLLVPCTDWFITFTQLGRGDARSAVAVTPIILLAQMALLPLYLWLFLGDALATTLAPGRFAVVFLVLVVLPLATAFALERLAPNRERLVARLGWFPVPLLAFVVFLIAAAQAPTVAAALPLLGAVVLPCILYLVGAALLGRALGQAFGLPVAQARTLVFSLATRNSFVVLPFALALPDSARLAALVIVFQSLIELLGMIVFLRWVPRRLLPEAQA